MNLDNIVDLKIDNEEIEVEFEVLPVIDTSDIHDERRKKILEGIASIDEQLSVVEERIKELKN